MMDCDVSVSLCCIKMINSYLTEHAQYMHIIMLPFIRSPKNYNTNKLLIYWKNVLASSHVCLGVPPPSPQDKNESSHFSWDGQLHEFD